MLTPFAITILSAAEFNAFLTKCKGKNKNRHPAV
jgi:hypothetical protein